MTEEFYQDFDFTDPDDTGKSEIPKTRTFFGELAFWAIPVNPFAKKGSYEGFTLLGVTDFEGTAAKVFNRQRVKQSKHTLFVLAAWVKNADGEIYSKVKQYGSWDEDNIWANYQYPALNALPNSYGAHLANSGKQGHRLYVSFNETETPTLLPSEFWKQDPETGLEIETFKTYWGDIQVFENEPAMTAAETEFRAQFDNGEVEEKDAWISAELEGEVNAATNGDWAGNLDVLKDEAIKVAEKPPAIQAKKLGMPEKLAAEVIARAMGVPF